MFGSKKNHIVHYNLTLVAKNQYGSILQTFVCKELIWALCYRRLVAKNQYDSILPPNGW